MKRLAIVAIASALALAAGAAFAADPNDKGTGNPPPHHDDKGGGKGGGKGGNPGGGTPGGGKPAGAQGQGQGAGAGVGNHGNNGQPNGFHPQGGAAFQPQSVGGNGGGGGNGNSGGHDDRRGHDFGGSQGGGYQPQGGGYQPQNRGYQPQGGGQNWSGRGGHGAPGFLPGNHDLRGRDHGRQWYSSNLFPQVFHFQHRYHYRPYDYPQGWYQRDWYYGDFLPFGWFTPDYYLDWSYFDLPAPPIGCEWVREGRDALLVDVWTGEILSVAHGMFW